jgi:hypothetical protein
VVGVVLLPIYSDLIQDFIRRFHKEAPDKGLELSEPALELFTRKVQKDMPSSVKALIIRSSR